MFLWLARLALPLMLMAFCSLAMLVPALHASVSGAHAVARAFFYPALFFGIVTLFTAIALAGRERQAVPTRQLFELLAVFALLPLMLAVPFQFAVRDTSLLNAYIEMVSALTTTGATLFDDPARLVPSVHLWRALVGWIGGLIMWVAAVAILAPMALGGFEIRAGLYSGESMGGWTQNAPGTRARPEHRLRVHAARLLPVYGGLTLVLWVALTLAGSPPLVALCHAMSTMSTSGISPVGGLENTDGFGGEIIVFLFFAFAISRLTFAREGRGGTPGQVLRDPEIRLAGVVIGLTTAFILLRHWIGALESDSELDLAAGLSAAWGAVFTVTSFLTTTGFESRGWDMAQAWSGLETTGLILLGLALIGGGVATTAGGVKLLRVYALYRHGMRELERLVHPHSVAGSGGEARHLRRQGAYISWLVFMLISISVAVFMLAFALTGEGFEEAMVLALAGLTTTGPLTQMAAETPIALVDLSAASKLILAGAMVVGRLETLAIVALITPALRRS